MAVPFVDLKAIHDPIRDRMLHAIEQVVRTDRYILGPEVAAFEQEVAAFLGVKHAIGVSSGTDALLVSLMALDVGPGDEVVTTPYTFFATAGAIARVGATPVFADIEHDSFNLDPERLAEAVTERTRAIIVVHLFGRPADMDRVSEVAARLDVPVIEDAAQAIGAEWGGRRVGGLGALGCFSFFPAKNLGGVGDGGLVTTNDDALAECVGRLRRHGAEGRYMHRDVGGNFRLDAIQAAVLRVKLPELEDWTATRQDNAMGYRERFRAAGLEEAVVQPEEGSGRHVWNQYVVRIKGGHRADVCDALREADIGCAVYYPLPLHQQPCFRDLAQAAGTLPEAELASRESLALPIAPGLTPAGQDEVVATLAEILDR